MHLEVRRDGRRRWLLGTVLRDSALALRTAARAFYPYRRRARGLRSFRSGAPRLGTPIRCGQNARVMRVLLLNPPGPSGRPFVREGRCEQRLSSYAYRMLPISLPSTAGAV